MKAKKSSRLLSAAKRYKRKLAIAERYKGGGRSASRAQTEQLERTISDLKRDLEDFRATLEARLSDATRGVPRANVQSQPAAEEKFRLLSQRWKADSEFASSVLEVATHPAYQQIIGMGPAAVPLIVRDLAREPDHWFWALKAITGEDPVPASERGDVSKMTRAWLDWAAENGYEP